MCFFTRCPSCDKRNFRRLIRAGDIEKKIQKLKSLLLTYIFFKLQKKKALFFAIRLWISSTTIFLTCPELFPWVLYSHTQFLLIAQDSMNYAKTSAENVIESFALIIALFQKDLLVCFFLTEVNFVL